MLKDSDSSPKKGRGLEIFFNLNYAFHQKLTIYLRNKNNFLSGDRILNYYCANSAVTDSRTGTGKEYRNLIQLNV